MHSSYNPIDPFTRPFYIRCEEYVLKQISTHRTSLTLIAASVVTAAEAELQGQFKTIRTLAEKASTQPYYKWNNMWTRQMQDVVRTTYE